MTLFPLGILLCMSKMTLNEKNGTSFLIKLFQINFLDKKMARCAEGMIETLLISAQNVVKITEEFKASIGKKRFYPTK